MLPATVAQMAANHRVGVAWLYEFQFLSSTQRFWNGVGFKSMSGYDWQGSGDLISASGLGYGRGMAAGQVTFRLAATTPELLLIAANSAEEVTKRPCAVFLQFLTDDGVPLDSRVVVWSGEMDVLAFNASVQTQSITLTAEGLFANRASSPFGYYTDADQQARFPGDTGLSYTASLIDKVVKWLNE